MFFTKRHSKQQNNLFNFILVVLFTFLYVFLVQKNGNGKYKSFLEARIYLYFFFFYKKNTEFKKKYYFNLKYPVFFGL